MRLLETRTLGWPCLLLSVAHTHTPTVSHITSTSFHCMHTHTHALHIYVTNLSHIFFLPHKAVQHQAPGLSLLMPDRVKYFMLKTSLMLKYKRYTVHQISNQCLILNIDWLPPLVFCLQLINCELRICFMDWAD